ncbi:YcxB family protein [Riemerella anatipestifer]|uniref:YcxB-like C-terminal domain-containing protein n=1 Tax=Riemerella anatipestifer TaxID=34085 RepID=A0A1S7DPA6_RIEAN|nr:YcxB family protein [Riemerella anatipestifer]AQY20968.1 hypothetical protein AB406_0001 [Riemerella anatipestifer]MCO4304955.1 YcxB family protein [Riemerella anatipestifer]MCO7353884.1 YcxB family protein [Riemerella anatipestifer]MCQ4040395.1 YcxB family protein [Riemerella anatipestifer]MCT6762003.1 YcxB family protein [Riemerella anatipestifer]
MNLQLSLDEKDYLQYQLYNASKSKSVNYQRMKTLIMMIVVFTLMFLYVYYKTNEFNFVILIIYIALIITYKFYEKYRYENHYKKFISENYKNRFGLVSDINFNENQIEEKSSLGSANVNYDSICEINEIKDYYFLKLITSQSLILPKKSISDITEFEKIIENWKSKYKIKHNKELNWKWR